MFSFLRFEWTKKKRFAAQTLSVKYFRLICVFGQMNYTKLIFFSKSKSDKWQTQLAFHSNKNCCFLLIFFFDAIPQLMFSWAAFLCFVFPNFVILGIYICRRHWHTALIRYQRLDANKIYKLTTYFMHIDHLRCHTASYRVYVYKKQKLGAMIILISFSD